MSTSAERLEKLNAYLVSKGRQPKNSGPVDFVKRNKSSIKRNGSSSILSIATNKRGKDDRNTPSQQEKKSKSSVVNNPRTPGPPKRHRQSQNVGNAPPSTKENKATTPCQMRSIKTPMHKTPVNKASESMRKKLVRRSISIANKSQIHTPNNLSKTPQKNRHPLTPASRINASVRQDRLLCKSAGPALKKVSRIGQFQKSEVKEQAVLHERLNRWLIAKGKKPLDGQKMRGFKPAKTIATPAGSPVCTPKPITKGGSHWQGLGDEDNTDELTVLIRNMMQDVQNCVQECCPPEIIRKPLDLLAERLPKVKLHAKFWVTLAQVEQYAGKNDQEICDLFEQAIIEKAQPIEDIQEAINSLALQKVKETHQLCCKSPGDSASNMPLSHRPIPTHQVKTPNPMISKLIDYERPVLKNAATSPIVFESPKHTPTEQVLTADSPSSVVKLRMVSKSSPVFKRLKLLRTLPDDASAIVTPVRRSRRIAAAHDSYPISLRDHEPCLSKVQEIFPALKQQSSTGNQNANVVYDIVFDPNLALGKDFSDISTVLKFE